MHRTLPAAAALAAAAACVSCAPVGEEPLAATPGLSTERQCFHVSRINGYSDAPDGPDGGERVYVKTGVRERWLIETYGPCHDLDWSRRIAIDSRPFTSVCTGRMVELVVPATSGGADRCSARVLGKMVEP